VGSLIHLVFHVSQLKLKLGRSVEVISQLPLVNDHSVIQTKPKEILDRHSRWFYNRAMVELLVCWQGQLAEEEAWEPFHHLKSSYPHLVGKVL